MQEKDGFGIVVLTNSLPGGSSYYSIPEMILDSYLNIEPNKLPD